MLAIDAARGKAGDKTFCQRSPRSLRLYVPSERNKAGMPKKSSDEHLATEMHISFWTPTANAKSFDCSQTGTTSEPIKFSKGRESTIPNACAPFAATVQFFFVVSILALEAPDTVDLQAAVAREESGREEIEVFALSGPKLARFGLSIRRVAIRYRLTQDRVSSP